MGHSLEIYQIRSESIHRRLTPRFVSSVMRDTDGVCMHHNPTGRYSSIRLQHVTIFLQVRTAFRHVSGAAIHSAT
jgi:hypothetical protein